MKITAYLILFCFILSCREGNETTEENAGPRDVKINTSELQLDSNSLSRGQQIFVATYSEVHWTEDQTELVASNLSIRNTSLTESIILKYVDFYDDHGNLFENYISEEVTIAPMASALYRLDQHDLKGGAGSNFLIEWESQVPVTMPYVENVSFRMSAAQSFSFTSPGVILREKK